MSNVVHSTFANTASDREIHLPGFSVASYSALLLVAGMVAGDVAYKQDDGTVWVYDGTITAWRILDRFITTSGSLSGLSGVHGGDRVYLTDTGQNGFWDAKNSIWNYV